MQELLFCYTSRHKLSEVLEDPDLALAAAVDPKFKLSRILENEQKAATVRLLEECRASAARLSKQRGHRRRQYFFFYFSRLPQALPTLTEVQQWVSDPTTDLINLARFPKIKKIIIRLNMEERMAERLLSKGRVVFIIKRKRLSDNNFEK